MKIDEAHYRQLKKKHMGLYQKFNTDITKWYLNRMFDYSELIHSAKNFHSFEQFYIYHTKNKGELIAETLEKMYDEAIKKGFAVSKDNVFEMLIVRLGNAWYGNYKEASVLNTFSNLSPYITCEKTTDEIDMNYKVDGIIELAGIDKLAIQIKPISYKSYSKGEELEFHKLFKTHFGCTVYYVYYTFSDSIIFNNVEIKLINKDKIIEQIEKILVYKKQSI